MNHKSYVVFTSVIFLVITLLHAARLFLGWGAEIGGWAVPLWLSWVAVPFFGFLAYSGCVLKKGTAQ
ncbi:MAG: hypothetical protein Q7S52_05020 [bacterium]|nr:hypothetical protein [bacterium]